MFPLHKLADLPLRTRQRKIARIIQSLEAELGRSRPIDERYARALLEILSSDPSAGDSARRLALAMGGGAEAAVIPAHFLPAPTAHFLLRGLNAVRHDLLRALHAEPSEWDLLNPETGSLDRSAARVFPVAVYLEDIRSPFNVGSIFRTAEAFGVERIILSPRTPLPAHPRAKKTARGADEVVAWEVAELASLAGRGGVFALELGGTPIGEFPFPSQGVVLLGSEELGLSPEALELADKGRGRVSIPQAGAKRSLNVSVAFGILMQRWYSFLADDATPTP